MRARRYSRYFPINSKLPLRVEWFDDTVDAIRSFSLENQRSVENLGKIKIVPLQEPEQESFNASVFDYVSAKTMLFVDEPSRLWDLAEKIYNENKAYADELWTVQELTEPAAMLKQYRLRLCSIIILMLLCRLICRCARLRRITATQSFGGRFARLAK